MRNLRKQYGEKFQARHGVKLGLMSFFVKASLEALRAFPQLNAEIEGDALFPEFDDVSEWQLVDREDFEADAKNDYPFSFLTYERIRSEAA